MSRKLEIGALVALCFFLPLYEAPKSIFWALYVVIWVVNRARARDFGGRWDTWDTLVAAWLGSAFLIAPLAGLQGDEWRGAIDVLRIGSVLWLVKRSRYEWREIRWVVGALVASAVIGVLWAIWALTTQINYLQLNSVGHVNHTAIYLAIILGLCASLALGSGRVSALAATAFILLALFLAASRGALLVGFATLALLAAAHPGRRRWLPAVLALVVATTAAAWLGSAEVVRKHEDYVDKQEVLARRDLVWRMGWEAWLRYPWAGVGIDNYNRIAYDDVKAWREARGEAFDRAKYARYGHGHSLYVNTLAERGIIGSLPVAALLVAWAAALVRSWRRQMDAQEWLLWGAAAAAWIVTAGIGLANTTLHHEHGILAALLLGLWLSKRPGR